MGELNPMTHQPVTTDRDIRKRWRARLRAAEGAILRAQRVLFRHRKKPIVQQPNFLMFDATDVTNIPKDAFAVAGYVGGRWPTYPSLVVKFPKAKKLSIAVNAGQRAQCLDIEKGDAVPSQVPAWIKDRATGFPVLYASISQMPAVLAELKKASI